MTHSNLYLLNTLCKAPHDALFSFLIFIVGFQLGATPFQLLVLACLKPITALLSFFVCALLDRQPHFTRLYLILNTLTGSLPCFLFPLVDNVWYYVVAYAMVMVSARATYPVWTEHLKRGSALQAMGKIVSWGASIEYAIVALVPTFMAFLMDREPQSWRWVFLLSALLQLASIPLILCMGAKPETPPIGTVQASPYTLIIDPIKKGWSILKEKPAFKHYLAIFFIGGAGIIGTQPLLPLYFKQDLQLSYTELALAFSFCKGIAFLTTSHLWAQLIGRTSIYLANSLMNLFSCIFFVLLIAANGSVLCLYPAYLFYGSMQAGCKLSWNLSGAVFSQGEESTFYSNMNLALVGIRGIICPLAGFLLFYATNASTVFLLACVLCIAGIFYGLWVERHAPLTKRPPAAAPALCTN